MTEDWFEKAKKGVKETAEKVTDSDTYLGSDNETEKRDYNEAGGKEPMNPERHSRSRTNGRQKRSGHRDCWRVGNRSRQPRGT